MNSKIKLLASCVYLIMTCAMYGGDYGVINKLPQALTKLQLECHKGWGSGVTPEGWDTGNTAAMKAASVHLNDGLVDMIKQLVKTYYPEHYISDQYIKDYENSLYTAAGFNQLASNPSGDSQGSLAGEEVLSDASNGLEGTIADMVQAITGDDPKFDFKAWKRAWARASKVGDN